jgi:hypothetical protein
MAYRRRLVEEEKATKRDPLIKDKRRRKDERDTKHVMIIFGGLEAYQDQQNKKLTCRDMPRCSLCPFIHGVLKDRSPTTRATTSITSSRLVGSPGS